MAEQDQDADRQPYATEYTRTSATEAPNVAQSSATAVTQGTHDLSYLEGPPPAQASSGNQSTGRYFEGLAANAQLLGITKSQLLDSDAQSPFHSIASATSSHAHLPVSLQPTRTQHQYAHHPFFDCIPMPAFRDRTILAGATDPPLINRFTICWDMFAGGLFFSGDPTDERSWAFSDEFIEKWGNLLNFDLAELQRRAGGSAQ